MIKCICAFGIGVMVGCCYKSCKSKMCQMKDKDHSTKNQAEEPVRT